jgi:uncharacterized protein YecE (DUF72 family)
MLHVGTSGWQYEDWRRGVYPDGLAKSRWLEHYASCFGTTEVNNAFYRLPERKTFEDWARRVPADFVFAVKASRYLSHVKRLADPEEPVQRLTARLDGLGEKCGPILLQLPPNLPADLPALERVLAAFPATCRVAFEPRHRSWHTGEVRALLERAGAAYCLTDREGPAQPIWRTAGWGYVRFHAGRSAPRPSYGRDALASWAQRISELWPSGREDVYCFFNNDRHAAAPRDAARFAAAARRAGLVTSRAPAVRAFSMTGPT